MNKIAISAKTIFTDLQKIRQQHPLVHNITNLVAMNSSANMLLALGASPLMAHAEAELVEIVKISQALVINIGTLDKTWIAAMQIAQQAARQQRIPIVLDPVGAGASRLRTQTAQQLLTQGVDIVRGNGAEIIALTNAAISSKGVDSLVASKDAVTAAQQLAQQYHCVVVVSGRDDFIVTAANKLKLSNGTPLLTKVTAMGCSATAIIGAFAAINDQAAGAAAHAMAVFTIAAEYAAQTATGPGSFYVRLLDKLASLTAAELTLLESSGS